MAVLHYLGELTRLRRDYTQARELYDESLAILQNLNDQGGLATAHHGLGQLAAETGDFDQAIQHLSQALTIAVEIQFMPRILSVLIDIGRLFLKSDSQIERGVEVLSVVLHHPASNQQQRAQAESLLDKSQSVDSAQLSNLNSLLLDIQIALAGLSSDLEGTAEQPLVEPLTERELEILRLLSRGMSNAEISRHLVVAEGTVKARISRIYGKLGVRNRVEAVAKGRELSLLNDR